MIEQRIGKYAIAIRTIGKAGDKYQKLLDSIRNSRILPEKVIVVLPEGYALPRERLGWETFVYAPKSMIIQRIEALKHIDSPYTLFLDDDIEFDSGFVEKLLCPLTEGQFDCSTGPLFSFFPTSIAGIIAGTLTASVSKSLFHRDMYVKILRSGGWSYHTFDTAQKRYYPTESFAWTCFMIRTDVMRSLRMEDEQIWLERFGYACGDDRVMAYKLIKQGFKACIVSNAVYHHNDARTSTSKEEMDDVKPKYCMYYMHTVFWHRFIQDPETSSFQKIQNRFWFGYWKKSMEGYYLLKSMDKKNRKYAKAFRAGVAEGERYVGSTEYKNLPQIYKYEN